MLKRENATMKQQDTKTCWVEMGQRRYPIYIGQGLLSEAEILCPHIPKQQVMVVTNETVANLYLDSVTTLLKDKQCDSIVLPDGEQYKTLDTLNKIFDQLLQKKHHRSTVIIALGGGVVGDMAGFAASCYQRGVPFIQIPTSLLAQVDASVGGKTAVNHVLGKNMIGAFHQPLAVIIDTNTLNTLPEREFNAGLAEVIKYGLIHDENFFTWLEGNIEKIIAKDPQALQTMIYHCCAIKAEIVAADEREQGQRALLNLGHTFGHAFENGLGYGQWLHGEAVAAGMMVAAILSKDLGYVVHEDVARIQRLLQRCQLPTVAPQELSIKQCMDLMSVDKKVMDHRLRLVLLKTMGQGFVTDSVEDDAIISALKTCGLNKEE